MLRPLAYVVVACFSCAVAKAQWQLRAASPPGNVVAAVYDEARAVTVAIVATGQALASQTWEWDGNVWQQNAAAGDPGVGVDREAALMYDPFQQRVLLLDAEGPGSSGGWIQEYRGLGWTAIAPGTTRPPGAFSVAAAFDTARQVVVAHVLDQTWEWDGLSWALRAVTGAPGRIDRARMAYDPLRQRTMLVGGIYLDPASQTTQTNANTWEWDGAAWALASTEAAAARVDHALAFDGTRGRAVLYGGSTNGGPFWILFQDFSERVAAAWSNTGWLPAAPLGMLGSHLAVDLARGRVVLVGAETWELVRNDAPAFARLGSGCGAAGSVPQLDLDGGRMPWVGQTLQLRLTAPGNATAAVMCLGSSASQWLGVPLPLALPGMPGCSAWVSVDDAQLLAVLSGAAQASVAVPNSATLVGVTFYAQGLVPAAGANPAGLVVSNAVAMRVGLD